MSTTSLVWLRLGKSGDLGRSTAPRRQATTGDDGGPISSDQIAAVSKRIMPGSGAPSSHGVGASLLPRQVVGGRRYGRDTQRGRRVHRRPMISSRFAARSR